ncbi:MAG: hypothetical protein JHC84_19020, partial [Solirubrobacteraceae bacterium]|nr:hypothetical protein [Solirubrobacteraceae bacterium]
MTERPRRRRAALALLVLPVAIPLAALAAENRQAPAPPPAPTVMVPEQVSAARDVVPFGITADGATRTVWATGRTRPPSQLSGTTVVPPPASGPGQTLLLHGTIAADDQPTAWRRAPVPLDRNGDELAAGSWRIDDATAGPGTEATSKGAALHAGATTPAGAAALLVRIAEGGGARAAVLARGDDGRLRELPTPPGSDPFAAPPGAATPMAVFDAAAGRTGVLLAPAGRDGVLRWDGAAWTEEPWEDDEGDPLGARTAIALGATPAGDAVALFAGDPAAPDDARVRLARRDAQEEAFRPITLSGSPLLGGPMPAGVTRIEPVPAPGQPLTVADGHWWIDLIVTRTDNVAVSTTVHLDPTGAAGAAWCSPTLPDGTGCTRDLGFRLATVRGYRSQAFAEGGAFGTRAITSPVIPEATGDPAVREASASGGFLALDGERFVLRAGAGDDGTAATQSGAFDGAGLAVIGGARTVGRTMSGRGAFAAVDVNQPAFLDPTTDVALSPAGTPPEQAGAIALTASQGARRQIAGEAWQQVEIPGTGSPESGLQFELTAVAWPRPGTVIVAGRGGRLAELAPPQPLSTLTATQDIGAVGLVEAARDLDLLDVAAVGDDAWAVGRDGAAVHRTAAGWERVELAPALAGANLTQAAYAGPQAYVASDRGLLVATPSGELVRDEDLAALLQADGRPPAVTAVAGVPDGAVVIDGRYVREGAGQPWQRLTSPAEGDVVALAAWRDPAGGASVGPDGTPTTLRIAASIADSGRPLVGATLTLNFDEEDEEEQFQVEGPAIPADGRLAVLGADGWRDAFGLPLARSAGRDLGALSPPIAALAVDAAGTGWAVGGVGSLLAAAGGDLSSSPLGYEIPLGAVPPGTRPDTRLRPGATVLGKQPQIFVGGHPACLDECAGRGGEQVAADATLREALSTTAGLARPAQGPTVAVIGGGRAAVGGPPLSMAGAKRYADLLRSQPGITVAAAIGTGDAQTPESRRAFRTALAGLFPSNAGGPGQVIPVTTPPSPLADPASDTVAYAFDVPSTVNETTRVVVIDNAGGALRGGEDGPQATWLTAVLEEADRRGLPTTVVGAARLDDSPLAASDRDFQLELLDDGDARTYVSTDGVDDVNALNFGNRTWTASGGPLDVHHTAALGHATSFFTYVREESGEPQAEDPEPARGWAGPALLAIHEQSGSDDATVVPVLSHLHPGTLSAERGQAQPTGFFGHTGAGAGFLWRNPAGGPAAPVVESRTLPFVETSALLCALFEGADGCEGLLPLDIRYEVADPSVAVFVRARPQRQGAPPDIVLDEAGQPVVDARSGVLCPIRAGQTTVTVTVAGRVATYPLTVRESRAPQPRPGTAPCSFLGGQPRPPSPAQPPAPRCSASRHSP